MLRYKLKSKKSILSVVIFLFVNISIVTYLLREVPTSKYPETNYKVGKGLSHLPLRENASDSKKNFTGSINIVCICSKEKPVHKVLKFVKSLLLYRKNTLHLHIITDNVTKPSVSVLFKTWNLPNFETSIYTSSPYMEKDGQGQKLPHAGKINQNSVLGFFKLELHHVLPSYVNEVIFCDLDVMMLHDIYNLSALFADFDESHAIGIAPEMKIRPKSKMTGYSHKINAGLVLYKLSKLREIGWSDIWKRELKAMKTRKSSLSNVAEDILNLLYDKRLDIFYNVSCVWNVQLQPNVDYKMCPVQKGYKAVQATAKGMSATSKHIFPIMPLYLKTLETFMAIDGYRFALRSTPYHRVLPFLIASNTSQVENNQDITLALHAEFLQLGLVHKVADRWSGPVSVAVFGNDLEMSKSVNLKPKGNVNYHFVFRKMEDKELPRALLQNVAMTFAHSKYVMTTELNTWFPPATYNTTLQFLKHEDILDVVGISGFRTKCSFAEYPKTKRDLLRGMREGMLQSELEKLVFEKWIDSENIFSAGWPSTNINSLVLKRSSLDCLNNMAITKNFDLPCYNSTHWLNTNVTYLPSKLNIMTLTPDKENCFYKFD